MDKTRELSDARDIVERLREMAPSRPPDLIWGERSTRDLSNDIREAADTILSLLKQLENAREALESAENAINNNSPHLCRSILIAALKGHP